MENQYITIKGVYQDGQILPQSPFVPKGTYQVLITFLEPVEESETAVNVLMSQQEAHARLLEQLKITKREFEVLQLVQKGYSNARISTELELGDGTVRNYVTVLMDKIGGASRTELVAIAVEKGILELVKENN